MTTLVHPRLSAPQFKALDELCEFVDDGYLYVIGTKHRRMRSFKALERRELVELVPNHPLRVRIFPTEAGRSTLYYHRVRQFLNKKPA